MAGKIHILYTIPNFSTAGSGKALLNIATRLDKDRFDVSVACLHTRGSFFEKVQETGIPVHVFPFTASLDNKARGVAEIWKISRAFRRLDADLVHSFHYLDDYSEPMAARLAGKKWIFTKKNMAWTGRAWKVRSRLANGIIVQNTDMVRDFYPGKKNIALIPRGVNTEEFKPVEPVSSVLQKYGLPADSDIVMSVANLVPVKGIEVLINAFTSVAGQFPKAHLFIVGDDTSEYGQSLHALAQKSPFGARIFFTGKKPNVKDFLSNADVFVLPTLNIGRQEGSPVALLEAMSLGKYVLASDVAGIRDQLRNFRDHIFPAGDESRLAELLQQALELPAGERNAKGSSFRQEVLEHYTIEQEVRKHEAFYERISVARNVSTGILAEAGS